MIIICTATLSARPSPVTASFTSLGLYCVTGTEARAAATSASPLAWPTLIAVRALFWNSTRSTETADGAYSATSAVSSSASSGEPIGQRHGRIGADHTAGDRPHPAALACDHAVAAAREAGVDAEHGPGRIEHRFDPRQGPRPAADAGRVGAGRVDGRPRTQRAR